MPNHLIVWDIETVPDLRGFAAANGHDGKSDEEIREAMGEKFPNIQAVEWNSERFGYPQSQNGPPN
jgi:hypothetical protein